MSNSLINESSPYLRAHSENPVDWLPWADAAFEKAKKEDKPVFLSIGYSTCHWCHVMAEESFENRELAAILNESFVSVKVDREERPDVDSVYMKACTAVNGSGGWPLTAILTPEGAPFFLATYMPAENRNGRMGLKALLRAIAMKWKTERNDLIHASGEIVKLLKSDDFKAGKPEGSLPEKAAEQLMASFDDENGGFGKSLKFPSPQNLIFLTERAKLTGDRRFRQAVELTLRQMYRGGIYDHFGGGFCRYSTDAMWHTPHFEKTLYDNALMAFTYIQAWQDGHLALYRKLAEDTLDYVLRELKGSEGGFFAGQDADSKGMEGEYYLFTENEVCKVLGGEAGKHFCECYDITKEGNFEGRSIPNLLLNSRYNLLPEGYGEYTERLRLYREERMELFTDEKILAGRNGLMLMALSRAARAFSDRRYLMEAKELEGFILRSLVKDGRLHAVRMGERLYNPASLSDLSFCALGMLELYEADFDAGHIENAMKLAGEILKHFADEKGGFFDTPDDGEKLIIRPKEMYDGALPSGNSAVAVLLYKLFRLTGNAALGETADRQLDYIAMSLGAYPAGCAYAMTALSLRENGTREMVCAAPGDNVPQELEAILSRWAPELTVMLKSPANAMKLAELAPFTAHMEPQGDKAAYYICSEGVCALPIVY